jgi:hypothetical protein
MATQRFSGRYLVFAAALAGAAVFGPAVAGVGGLTAHSGPTIMADPPGCTSKTSTGSFSLACSPGATAGVTGLPTEEQLTEQNMFDHPGGTSR